ncbi:alpha-1,2-mannosidase, putative [Entamoeba histolytica HM-1:IMSS-B]|uniref:Alpha-1,2-mannosidase, putative n=5 Tax=Entamoeba histolytica TaxID=5759 RepID=C4LZ28_ENTH1|nr:alpha-1,2-mannosidase, putative [Entamoeba histolytica HM-1:IMSS]EMD49209.1 alpha 1,2-mannosidase, putative [Entamoeba histolytica KU27]EMH73925.1 alpha-1,2-mannosidase, putative [Entamoeba histolytica HM-1:IMSS-B]ENY61858.1 alpha-1,2-mannosidase, putative [Entamoeba histolytica HM-1:IMSS-A]GAT94099.1 alpha 1 2-mannosidase putative [Entamoeba histolytica]EAL49277.1 alpha-1,2-mannosidase, putative [Entamoeba histolytica HM-1:IMSS]|eukprot:XP_654665.1 alpha-1,2-mannosidase, putative [Entamoeba histolytica HM-1:IMSS]
MDLILSLILFSIQLCYGLKEDYVNIFIGTNNRYHLSKGNVYPSIGTPFSSHYITIQNVDLSEPWIFHWQNKDLFYGLRLTHQPSPWIRDYDFLLLLPTEIEEPTNGYINFIEKKPSFLSFSLDSMTIGVTSRQHFSMIKIESKNVFYLHFKTLNGINRFNQISLNRIDGIIQNGNAPSHFPLYVTLLTSQPISYFECKENNVLVQSGKYLQCYIKLNTTTEIKIGTSFISNEYSYSHALDSTTFSKEIQRNEEEWDKYFNKFNIPDSNSSVKADKKTFYSILYRSLLFPHNITENGYYKSPFDGKIYKGEMFTDVGYWDISRAQIPLLTLIAPSIVDQIIKSSYDIYKQSGNFPQWISPYHIDIMVGNHINCAIADGIVKGISSLNKTEIQMVLNGLIDDQKQVNFNTAIGRDGVKNYNNFGFVESEVFESVSKTLDYCHNDFCISQIAKYIGNKTIEDIYLSKAMNYIYLFNGKTKFFESKNKFGEFEPIEYKRWGDPYIEGNAIHYRFSVVQDIEGLANLFGGKKQLVNSIDDVFTESNNFYTGIYRQTIHEMTEMVEINKGQYAHGNEPIQHLIYLYKSLGYGEQAEPLLQDIIHSLYSSTENGYCGDEDNGQMSAWYILSVMGFYSVTPGTDQFVIGVPFFEKLEFEVNGKTTIIEKNITNGSKFVKRIYINGVRYHKLYFTYKTLTEGNHIVFEMDEHPSKQFLINSDYPYSISPKIQRLSFSSLQRLENLE